MHKKARKYLRFQWEGQQYEFSSLPFGLAPAPMVFTKLLKPVAAFLRKQAIRIIIYLDDMLIMAGSKEELRAHVELTMALLRHLGFILNAKKCLVEPRREVEFLGFVLNSIKMTLSKPEEKVSKIKKACRHLQNQTQTNGRQLAHLIGLLTSCTPAIGQAPLRYRAVQRLRNLAVSREFSYDREVLLSWEARLDLQWWVNNVSSDIARPIQIPPPVLTLETYASTVGWGAYCQEMKTPTGNSWSQEEAKHHMNWLELKGAFLALQCFAKGYQRAHILLRMDNHVAISYINKRGGTRSRALCDLALHLWEWCLKRTITVEALHLPGVQNVRADFESRH